MRYIVYGAGAVGGFLGGILTAAGKDVTLVTRGAHREAMATQGLVLKGKVSGRPEPIRVNAILPGEEKPPYDVVFVTLKAHQVAPNAERIAALRAKDGCYVFLQNGLPWWYFNRVASPYAGKHLNTLDPDGTLARTFPAEDIVGGVIFKPVDLQAPGVLSLADMPTDRMVLGETDNSRSARTEAIAADVGQAGWRTEISTDIRKSIWSKLVSNAVWNPLCAITQSSNNLIAAYPPARDLAVAMMQEALAVAASVGAAQEIDAEKVVADVAKRSATLSSTLADVRAGRQLELDALSRSIIEMSEITGVPTPNLRNVAALAGVIDQRITGDGVAIRPVSVR